MISRTRLLAGSTVAGVVLGIGAFLAVGPVQDPEPVSAQTIPSSTTTTLAITTTTTTTTIAVAEDEPQRGWLTVQAVGDTNFDPTYIYEFQQEGYDRAFERLDGIFERDDLTIVNLECSASELGVALDKAFAFQCDPDALPVARAHGVDVANLANNHGADFGIEAMLDSRDNVAAAGIAPVGVGDDVSEATAPALFEINGWTVAVLGMGGVVPADWWLATDERPGMASGDDIDQMVAAVRAADEVADLVFVSIHWMWELETEPRADDRERAEAMIAAGADAIFGHHPHRLGQVEFIDGRPVYWTLGNFVWPRLSEASATTAIARVMVSPDGEFIACSIPAFIRSGGRPEIDGPLECLEP